MGADNFVILYRVVPAEPGSSVETLGEKWQTFEVKQILIDTRTTEPNNQKVGGQLDVEKAIQRTLKTVDDPVLPLKKQKLEAFRKKLLEVL